MCHNVRLGLLELMGVVLQDVPVSLEGVEEGGTLGVHPQVLGVVRHAVVHLSQLSTGSEE